MTMEPEDLPFKVVGTNSHTEVLARATAGYGQDTAVSSARHGGERWIAEHRHERRARQGAKGVRFRL